MMDGLQILANKEPVIATHVGVFDPDSAADTYQRYRVEVETFVAAPDILNYQRQFIETVLNRQTTLACLVAPFGYGKTSTAIHIWSACEAAGLLAIPPFSCDSIAEMGQAITTALIYRLRINDNLMQAERVQHAFDRYLISSANRLAEQDAARYGVSFEVALHSIQDKIQSGHLQLEASATHLLSFLEELVAITLDSGFQGLVIIVDEFQQFLGNINKGVITSFRTLIWGLQTRGALPLGFLITMDPDTERNLTERGADILHRIRNHGLYLSFASIYDREFPRALWSRYAEALGFVRDSAAIVDHPTLDAIGQLCERSDLSNGPRTVINVFQRIARLYPTRQHPYSPFDLINDFLSGDIRFDGDRGKIASLVNEITAYDYIRRSPERIALIKLAAAFPRGCPPEVADRYGIRPAYDQLRDELRGEVLVELPEGVALVDLQEVGKPQNKLNIILKKYWLQITEADLISDKALDYFARYGIAPLFPEYASPQYGWKPETPNFLLTSTGSYFRVYEGSFFEEYPRRRIAAQVCFGLDDRVQPADYVDAQFIFLIKRSDQPDPAPINELDGIPTYIIAVPIHRAYERHLPRDIREIENFLSPVILTPGVLVSLLNYIDDQLPKLEGVSEQQRQRIDETQRKLQDFLLTMAISDHTFAAYGIQIYSRGAQAFRDALFQILRSRYPNYQTLILSAAWERLLDQYRQALAKISSAQRRGIEPVTDQKAALAGLFDQRQYAGFESYAKQYRGLVEIADWRGTAGALLFRRHPQENALIEVISVSGNLTLTEIYAAARRSGYLYQETDYLIDFLLLRGYIEQVEGEERFVLAATFTYDELIALANRTIEQIELVNQVMPTSTGVPLAAQIRELLSALQQHTLPLSDGQVWLLQHQRQLQTIARQAIQHQRGLAQQKIEALYRYRARFDEALPESVTGAFLDAHLNGAQRALHTDSVNLAAALQKLIAALRERIEQSVEVDTNHFEGFSDYIALMQRQLHSADHEQAKAEALLAQRHTHHDWVQLVDRLRRLNDMIGAAAAITDTTRLKQNLERLQSDIQQELSTEGLRSYRAIYERFAGVAQELQRELETLSRLAERQSSIRRADPVPSPPVTPPVQFEPTIEKSPPVMTAPISLQTEAVNLKAMFAQSSATADQFLRHLIELNESGELVIQRRRKRK